MSELSIVKRNAHFTDQSFKSPNAKRAKQALEPDDDVDMEIFAVVRPVKIIFRPE